MEKLSLNIAAEKNCTVKSYCNLTAVFTWIGLELGWKIYLHICSVSFMHVTCDDQTKSIECGGTIW
jgi:hypothetical protein